LSVVKIDGQTDTQRINNTQQIRQLLISTLALSLQLNADND